MYSTARTRWNIFIHLCHFSVQIIVVLNPLRLERLKFLNRQYSMYLYDLEVHGTWYVNNCKGTWVYLGTSLTGR